MKRSATIVALHAAARVPGGPPSVCFGLVVRDGRKEAPVLRRRRLIERSDDCARSIIARNPAGVVNTKNQLVATTQAEHQKTKRTQHLVEVGCDVLC